jgi:hypothetical protein
MHASFFPIPEASRISKSVRNVVGNNAMKWIQIGAWTVSQACSDEKQFGMNSEISTKNRLP